MVADTAREGTLEQTNEDVYNGTIVVRHVAFPAMFSEFEIPAGLTLSLGENRVLKNTHTFGKWGGKVEKYPLRERKNGVVS